MADKKRKDLPDVRIAKRPCRATVEQVVATHEGKEEVLARFMEGIGAPSSRQSTGSLWTTWVSFHHAMLGAEIEPLPLTIESTFFRNRSQDS